MPYITQEDRLAYDEAIDALASCLTGLPDDIELPGHVNYALTTLIARVALQRGVRYHVLAALLGALPMAHAELYRRLVVPYEDAKMTENGDLEELACCDS